MASVAEHATTHERGPIASLAQLRALAHPVRLRILRLCLDAPRTNQELARELGVAPASTLRHVRQLVRTGFLDPGEVRAGVRGAMERPYIATGASWQLVTRDVGAPELTKLIDLATVAAYQAEIATGSADTVRSQIRGTMKLREASVKGFVARVESLIHEYDERDESGGRQIAFLWSLHVVDGRRSSNAKRRT